MRPSRELLLVAALAAAAFVRVELLAVAFPFFGSMDEQAHVDLVHKLARGYLPREHDEPLDPASIGWFVAYGTVEYLAPAGVEPQPLWRVPRDVAARRARGLIAYWRATPNWEKGSPPVYYALLGLWLRLGALLGLSPGAQLQWLRVPNGIFVAVAVMLTWLLARRVAPERQDVRLGAPLLLALLPQDVFYFVSCDDLSLPLGVACLLLVMTWIERAGAGATGDGRAAKSGIATSTAATGMGASWLLPLAAGAVAAAAVLTKLTNLPALVVLAAAAAWLVARRRDRRVLAQSAIALAAAGVPVLLWMLRNHRLLGDWTGDADKARSQGLTRLGLHGMLAHPLFTPRGAWTFLRDLLADLWRGEVLWHGRTLGAGAWDAIFVLTSLIFLVASALAALRVRRAGGTPAATARALCWLHLAGSIALLALLSISFDYGNCVNPSREHPYFTSARLIAGAMPSFLVLYAWGASACLPRASRLGPTLLFVAIATIESVVVLRMWLAVAGSGYNWLHWP